METSWTDIAIAPADILLPGPDAELSAWAVVACDQYTSQPDYWQEVEKRVGAKPSALRITLPEIYLAQSESRVPDIKKAMAQYLREGLLREAVKRGFVLTERTTQHGARLGLLAAADLNSYDFSANSRSMIRATEGTILSRIPPRLKIRQGAALECPHVLLLADDIQKTVIAPLYARRGELRPLYDFPLMMGGGHLRGWAVEEPGLLHGVREALAALKSRLPKENPLLLAVGDGNHSLATAKTHWEQVKEGLSPEEAANHPARFALVEVENIHDPALRFEPIHRVLFHVDGEAVLRDFQEYGGARGMEMEEGMPGPGEQGAVMLVHGKALSLVFKHPGASLAVGTLQRFLDDYLQRHPEAEIDYIHGEQALRGLCAQEDTAGFLLPALSKEALLPAVREEGALPRKTFSMGEAHEKRYYMECRRIV